MTMQEAKNVIPAEETQVPQGLVNYLEKRTKWVNHPIRSRYSVTDIVGCRRTNYYKALGNEAEELVNDVTIENMWDSVRGDLLHQISYAYKWREMDIELKVALKDGRLATLAGRLDMYDWKTATIIDLKTTKYVKWQIKQGFIPKPEHILQLQCYNTMFSNTIPVKNLNILYVDMSDMVAYKVQKKDLTEWIMTRIQELEDCLTYNETPLGEVSGLCKYCKYQTRCYNDGNGLNTKPLSNPKKN